MKNLNICFIGCGDHANRFVYPSLANCPGTTLQAVCALDAAQAEENRKRHGANRAYTDYKEMILTEQPDAVIIIGPPRLHYEAGLFCADRKIPFYMEKPCGENPQQAEELCNAARKNSVFGQVGFMMRHSAVVREIARIEAENELGGLNYGTVKYFTSGPYRSDEIYGMPGLDDQSFLWRYLMVQAVHPVNLAASFLGEIAAIDSEIRFSGENLLVDIRLTDTDNRRMNALLHTFVAPGYGNLKFETELFYNNRSMIFTDAFQSLDYYPSTPSENGNARHWQFAHFGANNVKMGYETELKYFCDCVRSGSQKPGLTTLEDGRKTMQLLDTVRRQFNKGN